MLSLDFPKTKESKAAAMERIRADFASLPLAPPPSRKGVTPEEATELISRKFGAN